MNKEISADLLEKYNSCTVKLLPTQKKIDIDYSLKKISENQKIYEGCVMGLGIPWEIIACLHMLEAQFDFDKQILNGERWDQKTKLVPRGLGPFKSWSDAIKMAIKRRELPLKWGIAESLYFLECWNGLGYRNKGKVSPYLWAYSNHYSGGKFSKDGEYDGCLISRQVGAGTIMKILGLQSLEK